jgi:hypothetical protein
MRGGHQAIRRPGAAGLFQPGARAVLGVTVQRQRGQAEARPDRRAANLRTLSPEGNP